MDIQEKQAKWKQERPLFEAAFIHSHLLPFFNFNENTGDYEIKSEYENDEDRALSFNVLNTGWAMWLRAKRDAKAQAVPGWVSVETDLPREDQDILFYLDIDDVILDGYYSSNTFIAAHSTHLRSDVSHWMYHPLPPTTQEPTNDRN